MVASSFQGPVLQTNGRTEPMIVNDLWSVDYCEMWGKGRMILDRVTQLTLYLIIAQIILKMIMRLSMILVL